MRLFASVAAALTLVTATPAAAGDTSQSCPPYETLGTGPDLVLTPGLGSAPATWDTVKQALSEKYTVHLVHVAGFAGREADGPPDTIIDRAAEEIIAYLDCKQIDTTLYAGHSLGGFLGLKLASEAPERVERLVIVDSLPFFPLIFAPTATPDLVRPQADGFRAQILGQSDEAFLESQQAGVLRLVRNPDYHDTVVEWSVASDRPTFAGAMHALMTTDLRPQLAEIDTPTTVIAAANPFAPRARVEALYGDAYAALDGVELIVVEDSYHFIMFDQPEAFEQALISALDGTAQDLVEDGS